MKRGRCFCGAVTYEYSAAENWIGHCHCESCRRATASPFTTFMGVPYEGFAFNGAPLSVYVSSPGVRRSFCPRCGTPMAYESDRFPQEIHLYAATLEDPNSLRPRFHVHTAEQLGWIHLNDGLTRFPESGG